MPANLIAPLRRFLKACSGKSQSEILKLFLYMLIEENKVSKSGSILIYNPATNKLYLFNEEDFLFKRRYLKPSKNWQQTFDRWEGLAGAAFENKQTIEVTDISRDDRFSGSTNGIPIKAMVCVPIILPGQEEPFGVVSFHNDSAEEQFDSDTVELIETYVDVLANQLQHSPKRLSLERNAKIFIVRGRDELALAQLRNILHEQNLEPVVLKDKPKTGPEILEKLEEEIGKYAAGFVLLTPDDEGRLNGSSELLPRARQNVIFEGGYLVAQFRDTQRVCFLVQQRSGTSSNLDIPSDLRGMLYESFDTIDESRERILHVLEEWHLISSRISQKSHASTRSI